MSVPFGSIAAASEGGRREATAGSGSPQQHQRRRRTADSKGEGQDEDQKTGGWSRQAPFSPEVVMSVGLAGGDDAPRQVQQEQGQRFDFNAEGTDGRGGRVRKPNA